jgi:hypothetical protein
MRNCIALAVLCLAGTSGQAGELTVLQAASIDVGGYHGVAYYTSESAGYRVVATIAQGETGLPVRFEATLTEAQKVTITVPGRLGESSHVFELTRTGGKLVVASPEPTDKELTVAHEVTSN